MQTIKISVWDTSGKADQEHLKRDHTWVLVQRN